MKTLSLYVDKWFIAVAVDVDGNVLPLSLPNGEDRIWLFFHEDTANNRIVYGKGNEAHYRDGKPHYIGDVFTLIEQGDATYSYYSDKQKRLYDIFQDAGIFKDLHDVAQEEGTVDTYVSFSEDVEDIARLKFLEELKEANFNVKEFAARISHLALEGCCRQGTLQDRLSKPEHYLALEATNENLHYVIYEKTAFGDQYLLTREDTLLGCGLDMRRKALIETVVENINNSTHFLKAEDLPKEHRRMEQFADSWLQLIDKHDLSSPISLQGITFDCAPNNAYAVTIIKEQLATRTNSIVESIIRTIVRFIKGCNLTTNDINGIVFIGDTFNNKSFRETIKHHFAIDERVMHRYTDSDLPRIVNVYRYLDCGQFADETEEFYERATKAIADLEQYTAVILQAETAFGDQRWRDVISLCDKALDLNPTSAKAQQLKEKATEILDDLTVIQRIIAQIPELWDKKQYSLAIKELNRALEIDPGNRNVKSLWEQTKEKQERHIARIKVLESRISDYEVQNNYAEAIRVCESLITEDDPGNKPNWEKRKAGLREKENKRVKEIEALKNRTEELNRHLNRAETFLEERAYKKAAYEIERAKDCHIEDARIHGLETLINAALDQITDYERQLSNAISDSRWEEAKTVCEKLIALDTSDEWKDKLRDINDHIAKAAKLNSIRARIEAAKSSGEWSQVAAKCKEYLQIKEDTAISATLNEANEQLQSVEIQRQFDEAYASENWKEVIRLYNEYSILKRKPENNKKRSDAIRFQKYGNNAQSGTPTQEVTEQPAETPSKPASRLPKPKPRPSSAPTVGNTTDTTDRKTPARKGTRPPKRFSQQSASAVVTEKPAEQTTETKSTRKYPKVKRK